jgi:putative transposase
MILAHKTRLNPTTEQEAYFRKAVGTVRFTYNWGLARWKSLYEAGETPSAFSLKKEFNALKYDEFPWVAEVSGRCTEYGFTCLGRAFANFFRRVKAGEKEPGYPRFKSRRNPQQSFYVANSEIQIDGNSVRIPRLGWINMAEPLRFSGSIQSATISTSGHRWYISIAVQEVDRETAVTGESVGIDLGIKDAAILSDGRVFENQKHLYSELRKLRRLNRELSRREKGSAGWRRTQTKLAQLHATIRNRRLDAIHKFTTAVTQEYGIIGVEKLNVKGMMQNGHLARAIGDVGMYEIKRQLEYKAKLYGAVVVEIGQWFPSSRQCSACGCKNTELTLADRQWTCAACGCIHDRDVNAACNIRDEALRILPPSRETMHAATIW